MAFNFLSFQQFRSFRTQVRTFVTVAVVLSGAITISGINLASHLRAQHKLLVVSFNLPERELNQLGREALKLATLVNATTNEADEFDPNVAQQQVNLLSSRMKIVRTHNINRDLAEVPAITAVKDLPSLDPPWEQLQPQIERWLATPDDPVLRATLSAELIEFERLTSTLAEKYNFERRKQYFHLDGLRGKAVVLLAIISGLLVIFVILAIMATVRLLHERHQMLRLVRDKEARYRRIIETSEEGIWLLDRQGKTTFANQKMADLLGLTTAELANKTLWNFLASDTEIVAAQAYLNGLREGERSPYDLCLTRPDHQVIWLLTNGAPILDETGRETGTLCMLTDVTARKQFEQQLQVAKQRAEVANQAKSDFLACMSHELRTPLNGILGYAQVLRRSPTLSDQDNHGINVIYQCGSHLLTLINDILDLSKIEAQRLELAPATLDLRALLQQVMAICQIRAEQKGIQFICAPDSALPPQIEADEKRLQQVLINLVGNAIKFTPQGSVTLRVKMLERSPTDALLAFHIIDTGIGIATDDTKKLFRAFEQVGDRHNHTKGTGLGLAISQRLVKLMGGQIQVHSRLGQGSEFSFCIRAPLVTHNRPLPTHIPETLDTSSLDSSGIIGYRRIGAVSPHKTRYTILVIDDRWENQVVFSSLLEPIGFSIIKANNGRDGLEKLRVMQPDLVITDIVMPDMDGLEFLRYIRCQDNQKDIPVIVSSARVSTDDQQLALEHGGSAFLPKPVDKQALLHLLATHLKFEWLYPNPDMENNGERPLTTKALVLPTAQVLQRLLDLAERDNIRMLREHLAHLVDTNEAYAPFAEKIERLAKRFQTEEIETLLHNYLAKGVINAG